MRDTVVVAAALAQRPGRGGHAWAILNWVTGLRACDYDVVFVDRIDPSLGDVVAGVDWVTAVLGGCGIDWSLRVGDATTVGLGRDAVVARAHDGVLVDVMGYLDDDELRCRFATTVFLDIDPGFGQAWQAAGLATMFGHHDRYATVGLAVGSPGCGVPDLGLDWIPTLPPVDLAAWPASSGPDRGAFTSVGSWRGPFAPVVVDGVQHGLRAHQARALADVPARAGVAAELALDIDPTDGADRDRLLAGGWRLRQPADVADTPDAYRDYVSGSRGELGIAKDVYVGLRTGWCSDRSACYLASGRPVIVSDTGAAAHIPFGEGLVAFGDPDEAAALLREVDGDIDRHRKAARTLAEDLFDARKVATSLIERIR
jgi:hypothetical protein